MGLEDRLENAAEKAGGKIKETTGNVTNNESLEAEGRGDEVTADARTATEKLKNGTQD